MWCYADTTEKKFKFTNADCFGHSINLIIFMMKNARVMKQNFQY